MLRRFGLIAACLLSIGATSASAQQDPLLREIEGLGWRVAPAIGTIASVAQVRLSGDLRFLDAQPTSRFLELNGNPPSGGNYTLAPRSMNWFAIFSYNPSGYVRDDERLNPDELLRTLQRNNEAGIAERRRLGFPILNLTGWAVSPHYDVETRRLEWGTRLTSEGGEVIVNYTTRLLGRSGVINVILVSSPETLNSDIQAFRVALRGFDFMPGERYTEFRQGDRLAEYGLAALVVGGAAAAAASSGLLKGFGKFIGVLAIGAVVAVGAFFKRFLSKKR